MQCNSTGSLKRFFFFVYIENVQIWISSIICKINTVACSLLTSCLVTEISFTIYNTHTFVSEGLCTRVHVQKHHAKSYSLKLNAFNSFHLKTVYNFAPMTIFLKTEYKNWIGHWMGLDYLFLFTILQPVESLLTRSSPFP